ncbi:MAG: hypothetical protein ACYC39_06190 [Thiobacillus sp.]
MNTAVIKSSKLARLSGALVLATAAMLVLPGCVGIVHVLKADMDPVAGKVYRFKLYDMLGYYDEAGYEKSDTGLTLYKKGQLGFKVYGGESTPEQTAPYRWTVPGTDGAWEGVNIFNNGPIGKVGAFVNEGVPLLKAGDLVDVYVPTTLIPKERKFLTVIRLVCMAEDKACAKREKGSHRKAYGWVVQPKGQFDERLLNVTPHMDLTGHWLPGKEPKRPGLPAGATGDAPQARGWGGGLSPAYCWRSTPPS